MVFLVVGNETILRVPRTSTSPRMHVNLSTPIDRPLSLSYPNPCQPIFPSSPTHAASSAMPQERSLTVVLGPFGCLSCSGHTSTLSVVFLKDAGTHAQETRPVALHVLSSDIRCPYALSIPKEASPTHSHAALSATQPQNCLSRRYLRCTFVTFKRPLLLITPRKMTHSRSEAVVVEGSDSYR